MDLFVFWELKREKPVSDRLSRRWRFEHASATFISQRSPCTQQRHESRGLNQLSRPEEA